MYLNTPKDEQHDQGRNENERKSWLMRELADILRADPDSQKPWAHAPGVGQGLCVDCGSMRITFVESQLLRDRGRCNLVLEVFDTLSNDHRTYEFIGQMPQVKLTKSATAIYNQLKHSNVLSQLQTYSKSVEDKNQLFRRESAIALEMVQALASIWPGLDAHPRSPGIAELSGSVGGVKVKASTRWHRPTELDTLTLTNLTGGEARVILAALRFYQEAEE